MPLATPAGYRALDEATLAAYLETVPTIAGRLGGAAADWRVAEVGDGNLNLVFLVEGPNDGVCVKQALPYVRLVGDGWPLPLERAWFEHEATQIQARHAAERLPAILHYDPQLYLIAMERLAPHIIMRRGMIAGTVYPAFVDHMVEYTANALYFTSDLALRAGEKKRLVAQFAGNTELCKITEDLIFTDPYRIAELNRWTSPELDDVALAIRGDDGLKRAVSLLKLKFLSRGEALLHGDLHTGSIMVTATDTKVIDPEFAFFGPMGFDVGKLIGNLLLSYFSQAGHEQEAGERDDYRAWITATIERFWNGFERRFIELWLANRTGDAFPADLFENADTEGSDAGRRSLGQAQHIFMRELFEDCLGYAGCSMIRRILGLAHNIDMEWIEDQGRRAACERRTLGLAVDLVKQARQIPSIEAVTAKAAALQAAA
ncbi:MAG: S-methyl-5-thioribose kinase [Geminicoccaceae bacterium]|nr:S-methyl-5-thioribose kinase [Geminicoccaceae bacterium]